MWLFKLKLDKAKIIFIIFNIIYKFKFINKDKLRPYSAKSHLNSYIKCVKRKNYII